MKNFFKKFQSYSFWVSLSGAVIVLLNALGSAFGFQIENQIVEDVIMSVAGVLMVLGVVSMKGSTGASNDDNENNESSEDAQEAEKETDTSNASKTNENEEPLVEKDEENVDENKQK